LPSGGIFGLFGGADGAFEAPVPKDSPGAPSFIATAANPSLARAAVIAAEDLAASGGSSLLVLEQGDIDWAEHANDYGRMIGAIASLDDAVRAVESFIDRPGDSVTWENSLLVVTADHSTGLLRFDTGLAMERGDLPEYSSGGVYAFPGGDASFETKGHANELVTLAAKGASAEAVFSPYVGAGRPGTRIVENTAIYLALRSFAGQ
jgi:alkaline phosphatase